MENKIRSLSHQQFHDISSELKDSILCVDDSASDVLLWNGGGVQNFTKEHGIQIIHSLSSTLPDIKDQFGSSPSRIIFFISNFLHESQSNIETSLQYFSSIYSTLCECLVYTALDKKAHTEFTLLTKKREEEGGSTVDPFDAFINSFQQVMDASKKEGQRKKKGLVVIEWFPVLACATFVNGTVFLSACGTFFPLINVDTREKEKDDQSLGHNVSESFRRALINRTSQGSNMLKLVHSIHSMVHFLGYREDIYAIGETAKFVGKELNASLTTVVQSQLDTVSTIPLASVILVDRTLDMVAGGGHPENLLDRMNSILLHQATLDTPSLNLFQYNMKEFLPLTEMMELDLPEPPNEALLTTLKDIQQSPLQGCVTIGSLCHPNNKHAWPVVESAVLRKEKDALQDVRKKLVDILTREKVSFTMPKMGNVTVKQLSSLLNSLLSVPSLFYKYNKFVQYVGAIVTTLQSPLNEQWEQLAGVEKILLMSGEDNTSSLLSRLTEMLSKSVHISLKEVLNLTILSFSFVGEKGFSKSDQDNFTEAFIHALIARSKGNSTELQGMEWIGINEKEEFEKIITQEGQLIEESSHKDLFQRIRMQFHNLLECLSNISKSRSHLKELRNLFKTTRSGTSYEPLCTQIMSLVLDDKRIELHDVERVSSVANSSIGNILKTGFSRFSFGLTAKPRPMDNNVVILLVIGGITCNEIRELKEFISKQSLAASHEIIIGSTGIATPNTILQNVVDQMSSHL